MNVNGFVWDGVISSTDLTAQIQRGGSIPVVAAYGLTNGIVSGTNFIGLDTNAVAALVAIYSVGPTNGIGTSAFFTLLNNWITTNTVAVTNITASASSSNILATSASGGEVAIPWAQFPGSSGNTPNAYITNRPNAMPGFTNYSIGIGADTFTGTNFVGIGNGFPMWIGDPIGSGGSQANIAIDAYQSDFVSPALDSLIFVGSLTTNYAHEAVSFGSAITNNHSSTFIYNSSGAFVGPSADNEALFFPGNGFGIDTNNPQGSALTVSGPVNINGSLTVNGNLIGAGNLTPWSSDINAADFSLTNLNSIYGVNNNAHLVFDNSGFTLSAKGVNIGTLDQNQNPISPFYLGIQLTSIGGKPVQLYPDFGSDNGAIVSDGAGNLTAVNLTNANVYASGTVSDFLSASITNTATIANDSQVVAGDIQSAGSINGSAYFVNGQPVSFLSNTVAQIWCTNCLGAATNYNGLYNLDVPSGYSIGYWTNHNGTTYSIAPASPFFGICIMCTNFPDATNGSPPLAAQYVSFGKYGSVYGNWPIEFVSSSQATNGSPNVTVYTQTIPWPTTVTSSNTTIGVNASTNAGTINYDLSLTAGGGLLGVGTNKPVVVNANPLMFIGTNYDAGGTALIVSNALTADFNNAITNTQVNSTMGDMVFASESISNEFGLGGISFFNSGADFNGGGPWIFQGTVEAPVFSGVSTPASFVGNFTGGTISGNGMNITNLSIAGFQTGLVRLSNGTNIVGASWFNSNAPPSFTYISDDGTLSTLGLKPSEWIQGQSFTIRSANSNDTNRVSYVFP
jgi:hypothetical protein